MKVTNGQLSVHCPTETNAVKKQHNPQIAKEPGNPRSQRQYEKQNKFNHNQ